MWVCNAAWCQSGNLSIVLFQRNFVGKEEKQSTLNSAYDLLMFQSFYAVDKIATRLHTLEVSLWKILVKSTMHLNTLTLQAYNATNMSALICGNTQNNTDAYNICDKNSISAPDNLSMMQGHNSLIIGKPQMFIIASTLTVSKKPRIW